MHNQDRELSFDIHEMPFSYHRSWLNISPVIAEHVVADDLHLITHQTGFNPVLALIPWYQQRCSTTVTTKPSRLTWTNEQGVVSAAFENENTLRITGRGLGMKIAAATDLLTPFSGIFFFTSPADRSFTYTNYESGRRYRVTVLSGQAHVHGDNALGVAERSITVTSDADSWEVAVEEFSNAGPAYVSAATFDEVVSAARAHFTAFLEDVAPWRCDRTPAAAHAAYVLWSATVGAAGFLTRPAVLMSKHWMDKVWSWDHCFNSLALAAGRPTLALDQFLTPFDHQDASGALPDSVAHSEILYNFVKPPVHGWALQQLRRRLPHDLGDRQLQEIYQQLAKWTSFWLRARRAPGSTLAYYQHGNDSGWDNSTTFDQSRLVETADLAAFLSQQAAVLSELAAELGQESDSRYWEEQSAAIRQSMVGELWDGSRFQARNPVTGDLYSSLSLLCLLPIAIGDQLPDDVHHQLVATVREHLTTWGLATEPPTSQEYRSDGYWRGPIWAPSTVLIEDGLRRAGHTELADEICSRFLALCAKSGCAENFDALTGEGLRDRAYTWTASAYLILAGDSEQRRSELVSNEQR